MVLFFTDIARWMQAHQLMCPVKKYLHTICPGCGMQRSFIALLSGDLKESLILHPVTIPLLLFFLYAFLHVFFRFKNGNRLLIYFYITVMILVVTNYIYNICKTL